MKKKKTDNSAAETWISKSAKKRNSAALQKLGEQLCGLSPQYRQKLNLAADLEEALCENDKIKNHEAGRRQRQYIGKLMREVDLQNLAKNIAVCMEKGEIPQTLAIKLLNEFQKPELEPKENQ